MAALGLKKFLDPPLVNVTVHLLFQQTSAR